MSSTAASAEEASTVLLPGAAVRSTLDAAASIAKGVRARLVRFKATAPGAPPISSLYKLAAQPIDSVLVMPKDYFRASNELVACTLLVCWTVTLLVDPRIVVDHPARRFVGHYNPCFGWDYPPASYIAVCACGVDVYLAWTYAMLEAMRTKLRDTDGKTTWSERFSLVTAYLHGVAAVLWLLLWSVGPPDGNWAMHLAIFSVAVVCRYLCALGNYVEARFGVAYEQGLVQPRHTRFIVAYGLIVLALPTLYFYDVAVYALEGRVGVDPPLPWWLLQALDISWCVALSMSSRLSVPEPPLHITRRVLEFEDEFSEDEAHGEELLQQGHTPVIPYAA